MGSRWSRALALGAITMVAGCATDPAFEQPHGESVKRMIAAQTYDSARDGALRYDGERVQRSVQYYREAEVQRTGDRLGDIEPNR